jgi:cation diffusion facilitator family transporter
VVKLSIGVISGSVAVFSDGIDSLQDLIASGIALASVRYGAKPPDAKHPYGHGGAETMAAGVQAVLIAVGGVFILYSSVRRIVDPPGSIEADLAVIVMLVAAAANLLLVQYTRRVAVQTNSPAIASEARHLMTNVVQAVAVALGLVVVLITDEVALDGVIALFLGFYLLWIAFGILKASAAGVLDASLHEDELEALEDTIQAAMPSEVDYHDVRTRRVGQVPHIDFHMTFPDDMTVKVSHDIIVEVEEEIWRLWPNAVITVHAEPHSEAPQQARL